MLTPSFFLNSLASVLDISPLILNTVAVLKYLKLLNGPFLIFPLSLYVCFPLCLEQFFLISLTHTHTSFQLRAFHLGNFPRSSFQVQIWIRCSSLLLLEYLIDLYFLAFKKSIVNAYLLICLLQELFEIRSYIFSTLSLMPFSVPSTHDLDMRALER